MRSKRIGFLMVLMMLCFLSGCQINRTKKAVTECKRDIYAMDTYMSLEAYGKNAKEAVDVSVKEIHRIENLVSTGISDSEISQINQEKKGKVSEATEELLQYSKRLYKNTGGSFNIAVYPVMCAWGFPTQNYRIPEKKELGQLLQHMDVSKIQLDTDKHKVTLQDPQMEIDLGGIAKGYTSSQIMDIYKKYNITSGIINLGGNVQTYGKKQDGGLWKIGIESPKKDGTYIGGLSVSDKAVVTSGGYERYFEKNGHVYHHIIDPATGYPAENGIVSATIVSRDGTLADGLSTSLFILGREKALNYWKEHSGEFDTVLMEQDGSIWVTEGLKEFFSSDKKYQIVSK